MGLIALPQQLVAQPQYLAPLVKPGFWRLIDIQSLPPVGVGPVTRTLNATAKLDTGIGGKCVNFVAAGDYIDYGADANLQLSTLTGIAVLEVPAGFGSFSIFDTNYGLVNNGGFHIGVEGDGTIQVTKADIAAIARTTKTIKSGTGITAVAWSYNNVTGLCRVSIDGSIETFTSAQTLLHGTVVRNKYYNASTGLPNTYSTPHKAYLLAISASDAVSNSELVAWTSAPYSIFKAPPRRLYVVPSSGSSGTVNYTNANDTSAASGTTTVTGSFAKTNANDTSSASGSTTVTGSLARTNANDVSSASGTTTVTGNTSVTNADDSCAASGSVGSSVSGSVNYTNANDTLAAAGTTTVTGSLAKTNSNDTSAASGTTTVLGTSSTTNANDSCVASGVAGQISGTVAYTNANDSCAASGTAGDQNNGGHFAGVGYTRKPKDRKHKKDDEIRLALIREIEGEQEEIEQSAAPVEVKAQVARIVKPYIAEKPESVDIATLEQDLSRVKQLLAEWQAEVQRGIDEDEELLFMFH